MKLGNGNGKGDGDGLERNPKSECREKDMSHLSCDCLQRCQGKSLRICNEITRNDCSQGFPNEIDAPPHSRALRKLLQVLAVCNEQWQGLWP